MAQDEDPDVKQLFAQLSKGEAPPELSREETVRLFGMQRDPENKYPYEPTTGEDAAKVTRDLGDLFITKYGSAGKELLNKAPSDIGIYHVPLDAFPGTTYPEDSRLLYLRHKPPTS